MRKLVPINKLNQLVKILRKKKLTIATTNGCFDLIHGGHVVYLEEAKQQGDVLIVGLNSDSSVRKLKGKTRPLIDERNRARMLCALQVVDYVVIFNELDPIRFISIIKPDVHVNGEEYGYNCIEAPAVKKHGGKIYLVKRRKGLATSKLFEKIRNMK